MNARLSVAAVFGAGRVLIGAGWCWLVLIDAGMKAGLGPCDRREVARLDIRFRGRAVRVCSETVRRRLGIASVQNALQRALD